MGAIAPNALGYTARTVEIFFFSRDTPVYLDDPPIVDVLESVAGDLLLMARAPVVRIFDGINVFVGMKPTGRLAERVPQSDLRSDHDERRLIFDDGGEPAVERHL